MIVTTYRGFVAGLTAGLSFCRAYLGERMVGFQGLVGDLLAEGARLAIISHMPGHPEQAEDALNQDGADRGLFRYRGETRESWALRVQNAWECYEQAGTDIQVLRAVNEWGAIVFPATWDSNIYMTEENTAGRFTVFIPANNLPWGPPVTYGSGFKFGDPNLMYGVSGALKEDVQTLVRVIGKWKRLSSRGTVVATIGGPIIGSLGFLVGGFTVGPAIRLTLDC